jgi:hypothetical protein
MEPLVSTSRPSRRWGTALALCAGVALGQPWAFAEAQTPGRAPRQAPPGCTSAVVVPDASFVALSGGGLRDASVWIDDIDSGLSGRFLPFEVYVVTGRVSAPFTVKQGKLSRDAFLKFTNGNYNTVVAKPIVVDAGRRQGQRTFTQDGRAYTLKVLDVQAATFTRDTITIQLCW